MYGYIKQQIHVLTVNTICTQNIIKKVLLFVAGEHCVDNIVCCFVCPSYQRLLEGKDSTQQSIWRRHGTRTNTTIITFRPKWSIRVKLLIQSLSKKNFSNYTKYIRNKDSMWPWELTKCNKFIWHETISKYQTQLKNLWLSRR